MIWQTDQNGGHICYVSDLNKFKANKFVLINSIFRYETQVFCPSFGWIPQKSY